MGGDRISVKFMAGADLVSGPYIKDGWESQTGIDVSYRPNNWQAHYGGSPFAPIRCSRECHLPRRRRRPNFLLTDLQDERLVKIVGTAVN